MRASVQVPPVLRSAGRERVRYDNERGKGDHRHMAGIEGPYSFTSIDQLLDDFERDVGSRGPL